MDREKVMSWLEGLAEPDWVLCYNDSEVQETAKQALDLIDELLKEQEAIKPIPPTNESDLWRCGGCNHQLFRCTHQRYCEMCGHEVKWE